MGAKEDPSLCPGGPAAWLQSRTPPEEQAGVLRVDPSMVWGTGPQPLGSNA